MRSNSQQNLEQEFLRVLETYSQAIRRLCSVNLKEASDREDLFQEIAAALWTALPRFRAAASERTWLYRVDSSLVFPSGSRIASIGVELTWNYPTRQVRPRKSQGFLIQ
jgi:hypothetical protein